MRGPELGLVTRSWIQAGDRPSVRIQQPAQHRYISAELLIRKTELADDRLLLGCTALLVDISPFVQDELSRWVADSGMLEPSPPSQDPSVALSADRRRLQLTWFSIETFARAWGGGLSQGVLPVPVGLALPRGRVVLQLQLPDDNSLLIPGRVVERRGQCFIDFRVQQGARRRLRGIAAQLGLG